MADVFRGLDGKFFFANNRQTKVSNWTVEASVNLLDKTELGDHAIANLPDLKSYTGTDSAARAKGTLSQRSLSRV